MYQTVVIDLAGVLSSPYVFPGTLSLIHYELFNMQLDEENKCGKNSFSWHITSRGNKTFLKRSTLHAGKSSANLQFWQRDILFIFLNFFSQHKFVNPPGVKVMKVKCSNNTSSHSYVTVKVWGGFKGCAGESWSLSQRGFTPNHNKPETLDASVTVWRSSKERIMWNLQLWKSSKTQKVWGQNQRSSS